ncbi:MAG: hypothetical protein WAV76_12865 [Bacteroidota bacterium]
MIAVGDEYCENLTIAKIDALLEKFK